MGYAGQVTTVGTTAAPATLPLGELCTIVSAIVSHGSTKQVIWTLQGSLGGDLWVNLNAAASSSTGTSVVTSTVAGIYDRARINVSSNTSTGNVTTTWKVAGVP